MTPMIDVVFQLIIFFMFTSQFGQLTRSDIELPTQRGEQQAATEEADLVIEITASGGYVMDRQTMSLEETERMIEGQVMRSADSNAVLVLVRADRAAPSGALNALTGAMARAGVRSWKLATAPGSGGG